jgi:hypothetical protein
MRQYPAVYHYIDKKYRTPKAPLHGAGQTYGIEHPEEIVLDEPCVIPRLARPDAEPILKRRQRTYPTRHLNHCAPDHRREMQPDHPPPAKSRDTTQDHEDDERRVNNDQAHREPTIQHQTPCGAIRVADAIIKKTMTPLTRVRTASAILSWRVRAPAAVEPEAYDRPG